MAAAAPTPHSQQPRRANKMPGKEPNMRALNSAAIEKIRKTCGSGSVLLPAIRICGEFSCDRVSDMVSVNAVRLLMCVDEVSDEARTTFHSTKPPNSTGNNTWYTGMTWTTDELRRAYESKDMLSLLEPDPTDVDVYYVLFHTPDMWKATVGCMSKDDVIDEVVQSFMREVSSDEYPLFSGASSKRGKIPRTYQMRLAFERQMTSQLLPYFHRLLMSTRAGATQAEVANASIDPAAAADTLDTTSADIFIAYASAC